MTASEVLAIHRQMVKTPSVSGSECELADWAEGYLRDLGAEVWRVGHSVVARAGSGPRLMLDTHLDTVPAAPGWTHEPWGARVLDGAVFGLGSNDAKASGAAMIGAFASVVHSGGPCEVVLALVEQEETTNKGTLSVLSWLQDELDWIPEGAVVGEPTELQIGVAQKGLLILELVAKGTVCHSARADELGATNAIFELADDLVRLRTLSLGPPDLFLGNTTLQVTVAHAGDVHNQLPSEAVATLDIRTVPGLNHDDLVSHIQGQVKSEVRVRSNRLKPYACKVEQRIVRAAIATSARSKPFGSATMSDQVHFRVTPCIKCGPGVSARSHTVDEFVLEAEIVDGFEFYTTLIHEFSKTKELA